ncbi:uncharacterized protein LOC141900587 [Tubulanus polymorphus]|uniref:uncharacterized protein LOC141900587 n=1 Tax=Tubulanus polymorphus TaxID=672921 RepID=UPI003DA60EF0
MKINALILFLTFYFNQQAFSTESVATEKTLEIIASNTTVGEGEPLYITCKTNGDVTKILLKHKRKGETGFKRFAENCNVYYEETKLRQDHYLEYIKKHVCDCVDGEFVVVIPRTPLAATGTWRCFMFDTGTRKVLEKNLNVTVIPNRAFRTTEKPQTEKLQHGSELMSSTMMIVLIAVAACLGLALVITCVVLAHNQKRRRKLEKLETRLVIGRQQSVASSNALSTEPLYNDYTSRMISQNPHIYGANAVVSEYDCIGNNDNEITYSSCGGGATGGGDPLMTPNNRVQEYMPMDEALDSLKYAKTCELPPIPGCSKEVTYHNMP